MPTTKELSCFVPVWERFWKRVKKNPTTECWEWFGSNSGGYGLIRHKRKRFSAHRFIYMAQIGPIPDGMEILHSCDNPACVNPKHLRVGTHAENMAEASERGLFPSRPGEASANAKLTNEQVIEIRQRHSSGESQRCLATVFGVGKSNIANITARKSWRHI